MPPQVTVLPPGDTSRTAQIMVDLARKARTDYAIRQLTESITKNIAHRDQLSEVLACYYWVKQNIRYVSDPWGVELVKDPGNVVRSRAGDCDDMSCLLMALCLCLGRPTRAITGGFRTTPGAEHVWCEVLIGDRWIALDPVPSRTSAMLRRVTNAMAFYA
jgi:transglutaminase-like putative cysteine protease